ncbi:MAG: hypothetical protein IJW70_01015 [Clostridia bacterium]|nr:hypothetical protein [Clostridia bacterium]
MKKTILLHILCTMLCAICGIFACAAQTSLLPHFINDSFFVIDLLLCLSLALGVHGGPAYGAFFGIFSGILADCTGGFGISLLPLFYMLCGYGASVAVQIIPNKKFPVYLATGAVCILGRALVALIYVTLSAGNIPLLDVGRYVLLPLLLGTALTLPFIYPVGLLLTLPVRKIKHDSIEKIL